MQMANLLIVDGPTVPNISFTPLEYAQFVKVVNQSVVDALHAGLVIGFLAGVIGVLAAFKYMEWKKQKDWEKYGKS